MEEKTIRKGNRFGGLCMLAFGGIISSTTNNTFLDVGGAIFMCEGIGDLISGDHHYVSSRVVNYLSKGKINLTGEYNNKFGK